MPSHSGLKANIPRSAKLMHRFCLYSAALPCGEWPFTFKVAGILPVTFSGSYNIAVDQKSGTISNRSFRIRNPLPESRIPRSSKRGGEETHSAGHPRKRTFSKTCFLSRPCSLVHSSEDPGFGRGGTRF